MSPRQPSRYVPPDEDSEGLIPAGHGWLGWMPVDLEDADSLKAALELIIADLRVPGRYVSPIQQTLFGIADDLDDLLHPERRERVLPPRPPVGGW